MYDKIYLFSCIFSPELATQLGSLSIINSTEDSGSSSGKLTSFELRLSKNQNSRAGQFIASSLSSPVDDFSFSFNGIKKPVESIDAAIHDNIKNLRQVEEERFAYNAVIERVRTPPPFHK